jgi:hypothetical protein
MSKQYFSAQAARDFSDGFRKQIYRLKLEARTTLGPCEAVKRAKSESFRRSLHSGGEEVLCATYKLEHVLYIRLNEKVTGETTWDTFDGLVSEVVADYEKLLTGTAA